MSNLISKLSTFSIYTLMSFAYIGIEKTVNAAQLDTQVNKAQNSSRLISQSCNNVDIRPPSNQSSEFRRGTKWVACNKYKLELQNDGNLVLYNQSGNAIWATGTENRGVDKLSVQSDGNVVLYDRNGKPLWATNTDRNPGSIFSIQGDGNLVVYRKDGKPIWASGTDRGQSKTRNASGEWLRAAGMQKTEYEVWLVARKPENSAVPLPSDAGHAWIAIIKSDGNGGWKTDSTFSFWPEAKNEPIVNQSTDFEQTNRLLKGESLSKRGQAVRKARISESRANWIKSGAYREAGCAKYQAVGGTGTSCNCADYATREWHVLTSKQEDFRIRAITINLTLDPLVDKINEKNRQVGNFLDDGLTWQ